MPCFEHPSPFGLKTENSRPSSLIVTPSSLGKCPVRRVTAESWGGGRDAPRWIELAPMHHARYLHGIALFAERILVYAGQFRDSVEMLTPPRAFGGEPPVGIFLSFI